MACQVTITSVTATGPPLSSVSVTGTATIPDCTSVLVVLECGGSAGPKLIVPVDSTGNWTANFTAAILKGSPCACGRSYVVTATCENSPGCGQGVAKGEFECLSQCPTAVVSASVGDCTPDGYRTVTLTATITPGTNPTIVTEWEPEPAVFAGAQAGLSNIITHDYPPGQTFNAVLHVVLPTGCPDLATIAIGPLAPCPCPGLDLTVSVSGCADSAKQSATATFTATLTPPGVNCGMYQWTFGDGQHQTTPGPTTTHSYSAPGTYAASVAIACGACLMSQSAVVTVPQCPNGGGNGGNGGGNGGEGWGCFGLRVLMTVAAILAIVALALAICLPPPAATTLAWIAAGIGAVAAIAGIIWGIFCSKPCAWALLLSWQVSIGVGCVLLCFTTCCPSFWWIGLSLVAAGIVLMLLWKHHCNKGTCGVLKELVIALSTVVVPLIGWLGMIPVLSACVNHTVATALGTLAGIVAAAATHCSGP